MSLVGIMWFDGTDKPMKEKVREGVAHFKEKYGHLPSVVTVNPQTLNAAIEVDGIPVRPQRETLKYHFFIMEEQGVTDGTES